MTHFRNRLTHTLYTVGKLSGMDWFVRIAFGLVAAHDYKEELNRRVRVESEMWECVVGEREMPDKEKLKEWSLKLGVPEWARK